MKDITDEDVENQIKRIQENRSKEKGVGMGSKDVYDRDIYGKGDNEYVKSIPMDDEMEDEEDTTTKKKSLPTYTAPTSLLIPKNGDDDEDVFKGFGASKISDRENDYLKQRKNRQLSPERKEGSGYKEGMERSKQEKKNREELEEKKKRVREKFDEDKTQKKRKSRWDQEEKKDSTTDTKTEIKSEPKKESSSSSSRSSSSSDRKSDSKYDSKDRERERERDRRDDRDKRDRYDSKSSSSRSSSSSDRKSDSKYDSKEKDREKREIKKEIKTEKVSEWEQEDEDKKPKRSRWEQTEDKNTTKKSRWDITPVAQQTGSETPSTEKKRSRWDVTPIGVGGETPLSSGNYTPKMTQEQLSISRVSQEMDERNRYLSDEELNELLPNEGYQILDPPQNYKPIRTPARKQITTPTPHGGSNFFVGEGMTVGTSDLDLQIEGLPALKPEDREFFQKLLKKEDEENLTDEEIKERRIMELLLKIKNGTPPMRKQALRHITNNAREFGAGPLFNLILPLMMSTTLEDQERHLLVKVIDRILYKLDELVRPHVHKILVVIEPLLIDEDYYARIEGREIISNLAKAAGLATMIATMRPDIDHADEYVRNTTARAFSVVAAALSIPSLLPFLKAVCKSKKSWQARHTGIKIVQQIAILMGCAILPHLTQLVNIISHGLDDEQPKVRTITALAISALAEASAPYGIESFHPVIKGLYLGIQENRGKILAAYIKAIGYIIPLMEPEYASHYTREAMEIIIKEFSSPDDEMKKIVLKVIKQCISTDGVQPKYVEQEILDPFFESFWIARMALDRRNYKALVETTVAISESVGLSKVIKRIVYRLKDDSEPFRKMTMEVIQKSIEKLGTSDIDQELEKQLVDHILHALQEQMTEDPNATILGGFAAVINGLGVRSKVYLPQICGTILWRLELKSPHVRQQSADLVSRIAPVIKVCGDEKLLTHFSKVLFECLGEEYPEVLGSIIGALKSIFNVVGIENMNPPIKELLPRLTPILKNRHEKVQEHTIDLVGRIADRGGDQVSIKEWMRICFELLEMLKAHKKGIRRAAVNTFGYIAKTIGPQDVLITLLNNLKVQERTNRVCTTVAIAIVAETCSPYTVLPALMNEYKVPELNVQNGVLKALSFLFEYIGEMGKDYIYAVTPLLEDALMDRDLVHRQTACTVVKHLSLGVFGLNCEDALSHLLNYVWPNIFETSPHVINAVMEAIEGLRVGVGPSRILQYLMQGLFHPARFVRKVYWKVYNTLYISSQDEIVPTYPVVPDDKERTYLRHDLDIMI